jgi:CheY-like chemotaxis protein
VRFGVAAPPPLPVASVRGLRVLVVDGSGASRAHLRHTLAAWGCECTLAGGGAEATAALARAGRSARPFDVVLVDRAMAEPSGTTAARLAAHPAAAGLPLIVLVPSGARARRDDGASFAAAVSKPLKSGALLAALVDMMGRDRRTEASGA